MFSRRYITPTQCNSSVPAPRKNLTGLSQNSCPGGPCQTCSSKSIPGEGGSQLCVEASSLVWAVLAECCTCTPESKPLLVPQALQGSHGEAEEQGRLHPPQLWFEAANDLQYIPQMLLEYRVRLACLTHLQGACLNLSAAACTTQVLSSGTLPICLVCAASMSSSTAIWSRPIWWLLGYLSRGVAERSPRNLDSWRLQTLGFQDRLLSTILTAKALQRRRLRMTGKLPL